MRESRQYNLLGVVFLLVWLTLSWVTLRFLSVGGYSTIAIGLAGLTVLTFGVCVVAFRAAQLAAACERP